MIRALLFDLDDTLILDEPVQEEALLTAAQLGSGLGADPHLLARRVGEIARRSWAEGPYHPYCDRIGHSAGEGLWARYDRGEHEAITGLRRWAPGYRLAAWQEALAEQGIDDEGLAAAMVERFGQARRRYPRFPEVEPLLRELRRRGCRLGVVTNGVPDLQREKLVGSGLLPLFDAAVISGEIDCGKPHPGIFRHICLELGVPAEESVMVGDNPARDVAGAAAAGMRSVWVRRYGRERGGRHLPDLECQELSAILPWLEQTQA